MTSITVRGGHTTVMSQNALAASTPADLSTAAPVCLASTEMAERAMVGCLLANATAVCNMCALYKVLIQQLAD